MTDIAIVSTPALSADKWTAFKRGFLGRCPRCGEGRMFGTYLTVNDACPVCGEALHHHRSDDAPPYVTILIVAHLIGAGILWVEEADWAPPLWLEWAFWPLATVALSLALLPRVKGALIGWQWALGMHGFQHRGERPAHAEASVRRS